MNISIACTSTAYNELTEHYPVTTKILKNDIFNCDMIMAGAENRPPMLDKTMYNSWHSRMLIYIKGKKNGRMMLESIENRPLVYLAIEENGTAKDIDERVKLLMQGVELPYQERECKLYNEFDRFTSVKVNFSNKFKGDKVRGEGLRHRQCTLPKRPRNLHGSGKGCCWFAQNSGKFLDDEQLAFLADAGIANVQDTQTTITHNAAFQTDDLLNTNVVVQDTKSSTQQDVMIMSVLEQMSNQVTNCNKIDLENKRVNESLTAELERYKE
ncbi:hypothetical protein Tco_0721381 [Tanacetum coccineum]